MAITFNPRAYTELHRTHDNCVLDEHDGCYVRTDIGTGRTVCHQPKRVQWAQADNPYFPDFSGDPTVANPEQKTVPLHSLPGIAPQPTRVAPSVTAVLPMPPYDTAPTDSPQNSWPHRLEDSTTTGDRSRTCHRWPFGRR